MSVELLRVLYMGDTRRFGRLAALLRHVVATPTLKSDPQRPIAIQMA